MPLLRSDRPEYSLKLPISKKTVRFTSFTMRTERTMMLATQAEDQDEVVNAVCNCIDDHLRGTDIKAEDLPQCEAELVLLNMRMKSVGEKVDIIITDPEDGETTYPISVALNKITIDLPKDFNTLVELSDGRIIKFRLPGLRSAEGMEEKENEFDMTMKILAKCIDQVVDGEDVYARADVSEKEFIEFLLELDAPDFQKISGEFFDKIPKLGTKVKFKRPDGTTGEVAVEGIGSFL